jgi:hypothetical protein
VSAGAGQRPTRAGAVAAAAALLMGLALLPAAARAQSPADLERAKESFKAGAVAYGAGDYLAAIQALESAHALTPLPAIAFSLAQAERRQYFVDHEPAHLDRAISLFRRYVQQVPSGGRRGDALDSLAQLEPLAAGRPGSSPAVAPALAAPPTAEVAPARPTRLMITAEAPAARLSLDGEPAAASPLIRRVQPGQHSVEVTAPGFFPVTRELTAVPGELIPVALTLNERPSGLAIAAPGGTELFLDGVFMGRGGASLTLLLPSGPHRLTAARNGYRVWSRDLKLERGQTSEVRVQLQPTGQRAAARLLFIGGGVALGAGVVFAALGFRAQQRAQDFLDRQARGNVSSGALDDYGSDVIARDRYRLASAGALASALGLTITALFLHELDHPAQEDLSGARQLLQVPSPPPVRAAASARRSVAPLAVAGGWGALFSTAF